MVKKKKAERQHETTSEKLCKSNPGKGRRMWRRERRKWTRVSRSRQGGMEIDSSRETKSRFEGEAFESERKKDILNAYAVCAVYTVYDFLCEWIVDIELSVATTYPS